MTATRHSFFFVGFGLLLILGLIVTPAVALQDAALQGEPSEKKPVVEQEKEQQEKQKEESDEAAEVKLQEEENPILRLVDEISTNMKKIEELLNQKNTGSSTQGVQDRTIEQLDKLIEEVEKQCSSSSGGSSSQQRRKQQKSQDQKQAKQQQQMAKKEPNKPQGEPNSPEEVPNNKTTEGKIPGVQVGNLQGREGSGRWGRLPKRIVEQMYDNGRRKLPEKYRLLLEEYFGRLPQSKGQ